jgi:hypothetical protein
MPAWGLEQMYASYHAVRQQDYKLTELKLQGIKKRTETPSFLTHIILNITFFK